MPTRLRKIRKLRGSRTCGWGRVGQHRKSGMRGGFGKAGLHKHKWTWTVKYAPDYFGKRGFKSPMQKIRLKFKEVNVGELADILSKLEKVEFQDGKPIVDLPLLGYGKLLGRGELKIPIIVKAISFTENAAEKVKKAGGEIIEVKV
ncbi:uL15 family ribosomal protein [Candidatus Bathyarchaeota archaeon]|nr:uL15 family ribosomal protein [Candidatus Bathyarchaeota archaeon]MBS7614101.1 uL15 family ribosomal protein [Candidatus Bathyarchaeota archaeon]